MDLVNPATETAVTQDQQALQLQLRAAERVLSGLQADLRVVDAEWKALADRRIQFESLEHACQSLEKLRELGLSRAFWGDRASDDEVAAHVAGVRGKIAELGSELGEVEQRRTAARERVSRQLDSIAFVEDDLEEAIQAEERRQQEWVIEREETGVPWHPQIMPWARAQEDDHRFRRTLLASAAICLLLGVVLPYIDIPLPERDEVVEAPERLARLIRKETPRPMPTPRKEQEEQRLAEKPREVEPVVPPETVPEVAPKVVPEPVPENQVAAASGGQRAPAGLLAFRESFSNLANSRPSARLGSEARISRAGELSAGLPERAMVATNGPGSSGGINLASLSRDVGDGAGGGQMGGVVLSRVGSSIGGGNGDGSDNVAGNGSGPLKSAGGIAGRTDEEIQIVFDRYKSALYRLYNRELRNDPTLRGQMVLRLTIEPDGTVSFCTLESTDMGAPLLADQVVQRILGFDFGAKEVPPVTILYPIDFLPTA